jgi:hypothetical protein
MKTTEDMVFVALNGRVVALDWEAGHIHWQWQAPKSGSYMTLLPDRDRLVVSAGGYLYCLDAATGQQLWENPLTGFGCGVAALATVGQRTPDAQLAAAAAARDAEMAAITTTATVIASS